MTGRQLVVKVYKQRQLVLQNARGIGHGIFGGYRAVGFDGQVQLVVVQFLADARGIDLVGNLTHRRIQRIDRDQPDRRVDRTVRHGRDIALAGVGGQFHVERRAFVEVADHQVLVQNFDIACHRDVAGAHFARPGGRKLQTLGAFALHLERDLLNVEHDVGDVFTHAGKRREFVEHVFDADRSNRSALKRGQQHPAQRIAERQAKAAFERFGDEGRAALRIVAGPDLEGVGLLQFLPVLDVDSHGIPLGLIECAGVSISGCDRSNIGRCRRGGTATPDACRQVRPGDALTDGHRCAGSRSHRGWR